jgi:hypothetical protein
MKILYIIAAFLGACSFIAKASAGAELAPGTYRAEDRAHCPGSGKAPAKVVER